ncbi:putative ribosomal protein L18 [Helianthus debilis subsp. tardiflorus]
MVIPPPVKTQRITNFLKPSLLNMHFSNKFVSAQVIHAPTTTVAAAASSQKKVLREAWTQTKQSTRDVSAAAKIGKILGERLLINDIPAAM